MNISVLGGGVSGLASAIALKQQGFDVEVYERHSGLSDVGAGIVCWPNASFVLEQLGVLERIAAVSGKLIAMNRFSHQGDSLGGLNITRLNQLMGYASYSILRKGLMTILTERALQLKISIHYAHVVTSIDGRDGKATVSFRNGKTIEPDIVIGADGRMNSLARQFVNQMNLPRYQGFINWVGIFESTADVFDDLTVSDYWGVGERFGIVPVSSRKAYWAGGAVSSEVGECHPKSYLTELNALFDCWPSQVSTVINKTPLQHIHKIYVHDHDPIACWHKDNLVLVGDAAHAPLPTSGQGACQALEDAWHLANVLSDMNAGLTETFQQYTQLRMAKTTGIIMAGRQLASSIFNQDAQYCQQRNLASLNTDFEAMVNGMAQGWGSGLKIHMQS